MGSLTQFGVEYSPENLSLDEFVKKNEFLRFNVYIDNIQHAVNDCDIHPTCTHIQTHRHKHTHTQRPTHTHTHSSDQKDKKSRKAK